MLVEGGPLGAPTSMRNVLRPRSPPCAAATAAVPGLVTESVAPNGFKTTRTYDARGFLASTTAMDPVR